MRSFLTMGVIALFAACSSGTAPDDVTATPSAGEITFNSQCAACHGRKGDLGLNGAKDLRHSTLSREEAVAVITQGRNGMMGYGGRLTPEEIQALADHVLSLRAKP